MPKAKTPDVLCAKGEDAVRTQKKVAGIKSEKLPEGDDVGFLNTPDGELWYYVGQLTKNSSGSIEHFSFTVYDSAFKELATVEDDVVLAEDETRVVDVQLGSLVTKKFFNNDDKPEFIVAFAANTAAYVNHYYTKVYSSGVEGAIANFEGYWCTDVDTSTDKWSENYYIGFLTEQESATPEIGGLTNSMDYVIDIYKKAGYSSSCEVVHQLRIPSLLSTGESWIPVLALAHNGNAYFAVNYLKYSFYENPFDWNNENLTENNELVIDYYEVPRYGTPSLANKTTVPTTGSSSDLNYYYLGAFLYDEDVTYGRYTSDDVPAFTVTRAHYVTSSDSYSYSYDIYPAGSEENPLTEKILTLAENVDGATLMSDVRGYAPQVMFIHDDDENPTFDFVNLLNGTVECTLPYVIGDNITMNAGVDRVAGDETPLYAVSQYSAESDSEGNAIQAVAYINPDGTLHHVDRFNLGQNIAYAKVCNEAYALDPYIFNTDEDREYMAIVKRYTDDGSKNQEELLIISPSKGTLLTLLPDEELGSIAYVQLDNSAEYGQTLCVLYQTANYRLNTVRYELPFEKFAGGDGTAEDPYQIATLGDLRQVQFSPSANYVMVADLDARGKEMEHVAGSFTGTFDGDGHNIIGPVLDGNGIFEYITGESAQTAGGEVRNLNVLEPEMTLSDDKYVGIIANEISGAKISNVRIYDAVVKGTTDEVNATFGSVAGSAALYSEISGSAVIGADINLPESTVGGIAGNIATSTAVKVCSFNGGITGGKAVGGIVGATTAAGDRIEDCHVNATIVAKNTIGGVAGTSARGAMQRCHVQGSIEATEAPMWGGGASTGGLIGDLATDWDGSTEEATIKDNFINLSSLKAFEPSGEPDYDGEYDTFHRVIGASCANQEPAPIFDEEWNLIGFEDPMVENILSDNYVSDNIAICNDAIEDATTTTEGKSVSADELGKEFFENLGYVFGQDLSAPWNEMSPKSPRLYFENGMILFEENEYNVELENQAGLVIDVYGEESDEDILSELIVEIADESVVEYVDLSVDNGKITFVVKALKAGTTKVTASYKGQTTETTVTVEDNSDPDSVAKNIIDLIDYRAGVVKAQGCRIEVYSTTGAAVFSGQDIYDMNRLGNGVYVVRATDKSGHSSTLKVVR